MVNVWGGLGLACLVLVGMTIWGWGWNEFDLFNNEPSLLNVLGLGITILTVVLMVTLDMLDEKKKAVGV